MDWLIKLFYQLLDYWQSHQTPIIQPNPIPVPTEPLAPPLTFDTDRNAYHAVRVLCDNAGLTLDEKNLICACIFQERRFLNTAICHNRNAQGVVLSTDYGVVQCNDFYHIGPHKDFPSVEYVLANPDEAVSWMISMYKHGMLKQWVSFTSKAYLRWLTPGSPMWKLA